MLTGGIACGKTTVVQILKKQGVKYVVDLDAICHQLYFQPPLEIIPLFQENWGNEVVDKHGKINRYILSQKIFQKKDSRKDLEILNEITHPLILQRMQKTLEEIQNNVEHGFILIDIPLFFENCCSLQVDGVITVWTDFRTQLERLMKRNNISQEEAEKRISIQFPLDKKMEMSDFAIINTGTLDVLYKQCEILRHSLDNVSHN